MKLNLQGLTPVSRKIDILRSINELDVARKLTINPFGNARIFIEDIPSIKDRENILACVFREMGNSYSKYIVIYEKEEDFHAPQ